MRTNYDKFYGVYSLIETKLDKGAIKPAKTDEKKNDIRHT